MNLAKIPVGAPPTRVATMVGGTPTILTINHSKILFRTNAAVSLGQYRISFCCDYCQKERFFQCGQFWDGRKLLRKNHSIKIN